MKLYITFGQAHTHRHGKHVLDSNSVGVVNCDSVGHGREIVWGFFGDQWAFSYETLEEVGMEFYPRGLIVLN